MDILKRLKDSGRPLLQRRTVQNGTCIKIVSNYKEYSNEIPNSPTGLISSKPHPVQKKPRIVYTWRGTTVASSSDQHMQVQANNSHVPKPMNNIHGRSAGRLCFWLIQRPLTIQVVAVPIWLKRDNIFRYDFLESQNAIIYTRCRCIYMGLKERVMLHYIVGDTLNPHPQVGSTNCAIDSLLVPRRIPCVIDRNSLRFCPRSF